MRRRNLFYRVLFEYPDGNTMQIIIPTAAEIMVLQFLSFERFTKDGDDWYVRADGTRATYSLDVDGLAYIPEEENLE